MSVRARLLLAGVMVVALVLAIVTAFTLRVTMREFDRYIIRERSESLAQIGSALDAYAARQRNWADAAPFLNTVSKQRPLIVFDALGRPLAASKPDLLAASLRPTARGTQFELRARGRTIELFNPPQITLRDGTRVIALPAEPAGESVEQRSVSRSIIAVVIGTGLLAVLLIAGLARRITGPLEELTAAARAMGEGDLERRARVGGDDEIGRLAGAFNAMAGALAENERARRMMVSDIAHELRTPLTNMRCTIESLEDGIVPLDRNVVDTLHSEVRLLSRLVEDLQELALADAGRLRIERATVDVGDLLRRVTAQSHAIEVGVPEGLKVDADPMRLQQMVRNLVDNAARHSPRGSTITLRARPDGGRVLITIADHGRGIDPAHLPHIFDRFYRADASRSRETGGSGLGLAIVKALAEAHGGEVFARSAPGAGAEFTIRI